MSKRDRSTSKAVKTPVGGTELRRALVGLGDEYCMRAVAERDHDAAAIHIALMALSLQAARAGVPICLNVVHEV